MNRLRIIRAEKRISQAKLAKEAKISRTTLSAIENDQVKPEFDTVARLVRTLGVPASEIFSDFDVVCTQR